MKTLLILRKPGEQNRIPQTIPLPHALRSTVGRSSAPSRRKQTCAGWLCFFLFASLTAAIGPFASGQLYNTGQAIGTLGLPDNDRVAFTVRESAQGTTDLNGDGDTTDTILHLANATTNTTLKIGNDVSSNRFLLNGDRVASVFSESGSGNTDFNSDGDTIDTVLHLFDVLANTTTNVMFHVTDFALDGDYTAFFVREGSQGNANLNGDGDTNNDQVVHVYNAATNTLFNVGLAANEQSLRFAGNKAVFTVSEFAQGSTDLNGDGDPLDSIAHILDVTTNTITFLPYAVGGVRIDDGKLVLFTVIEASQGNTDLNGDGDTGDRVVFIHNTATLTTTNTGLHAHDLAVFAVSGDLAAFVVQESNQGNTNLNGDGDTFDFVLHVYNAATLTTKNLGLSSNTFYVVKDHLIAFGVSEPAQGGTDLNGDGDAAEVVLHVYNALTDTTTNAGFNIGGIARIDGDWVAGMVAEGLEGLTDLNGDGDTFDFVAHAYNIVTHTTFNSGLSGIGPGQLFFEDGVVALAVNENIQGAGDLNGDGDVALDLVLHIYEPATHTVTNVGQDTAGIIFQTGNVVAFGVREASQGGISLNGDADASDTVAHIYTHPVSSGNTAPLITCPPDAEYNCAAASGHSVSIQVMVTDPEADHLIVTLENNGDLLGTEELDGPASDALVTFDSVLLPAGTHTLVVTVNDGQAADFCETTVTVNVDNTPPGITCPADIEANATSPAGAVVNYPAPTVTDDCGASVTCDPESGSVFPIGDTTVTCVAMDAAGNPVQCTFNVHVKGGGEQAEDLCDLIHAFGIHHGIANSLCVTLSHTASNLATGNVTTACNHLNAFINHVEAQSGKKLTAEQAAFLIAEAQGIQAVIGCP